MFAVLINWRKNSLSLQASFCTQTEGGTVFFFVGLDHAAFVRIPSVNVV